MGYPRTLPLFDPQAQPSSWNERMSPGEYAVHASSARGAQPQGPVCTVFAGLAEAESYAREQIVQQPTLRLSIYSADGFVGEPVCEFTGARFKGELDLSPRTRRWLGVAMLAVGCTLMLVDWSTDFRLTWPGVLGSRLLIPGFVLLAVEGLILLNAKQKKTRARA